MDWQTALVSLTLHRQFRVEALGATEKTDDQKLDFVRQALRERARLQEALRLEISRFVEEIADADPGVRAAYLRKIRSLIEKQKVLQIEGGPAVKALALDKYEAELNAYSKSLNAKQTPSAN